MKGLQPSRAPWSDLHSVVLGISTSLHLPAFSDTSTATHILALPAVCRVAHSDIRPPCSLPSTPQQMVLLTFPISTLATLGPHSQAVNLVRSALPPLLALWVAHTLTAFSLAGLSLSSHIDLSTTVNCLPAVTLITMPALSLEFWLCSAAVSTSRPRHQLAGSGSHHCY